jgi:ketosteroid isomerase-like protein
MNIRAIGPLLVLATAGIFQGCAAPPTASQANAELKMLSDRWDEAIVRKDRRAIEANMAEDFRQIDGFGNVETKSSFVADLMSPDVQIDPYTVEDFEVRLYGDVALLTGRTKMTGQYKGKPFKSHYRYIDIYVRNHRGWKIVSVQITRLPE